MMLPGTTAWHAPAAPATVEEYVAMPGIFAEDYAAPFVLAGRALVKLTEVTELPVSREDFAEVSGKAQEWKNAWRSFQDAVDEWIATTEGLNVDALTPDERDQVSDAFHRFKGIREEALDRNAETEAAFSVWVERAAAAAPEPGLAAALLELARGLAKNIPQAVSLWPLVPLGLGALGLLWIFGAPRRR